MLQVEGNYSPDQIDCINDMKQLLADWKNIKDPSSPTTAELAAICADINHLSFDTDKLAKSGRSIDQQIAHNIQALFLDVPFGKSQTTLAEAAKAYVPPDNVDLMRQTFAALYKDGSYPSVESVLESLIDDPFNPPAVPE